MNRNFEHDIFISFSSKDEDKVKEVCNKIQAFNLKPFWSKNLTRGKDFTTELEKALSQSRHFVLCFSKNSSQSSWVETEWRTFYDSYYMKDKDNRRMYVLLLEDNIADLIPKLLNNLHRPETADDLIAALFRNIRNSLNIQFAKYIDEKDKEINQLKIQLASERSAAFEQAQDYYRHNRFWRLISENGDVHIFTCGRDTPNIPNSQRGQGGRTNIDMWDYRAVFDLTHFFASNYPNTKVTIEDPMSKFQSKEMAKTTSLANRIAHMERMLENKDCIIVGSPDVNDFAEVVLARIHQIEPYTEGREKRKGFAIVKEHQVTTSSFYWEKLGHEKEGVAQILNPGEYEYFPHETASEGGGTGKMFGILVVADNPFCDKESSKKIIILSGFSGVATNAIAKIITNTHCLQHFFKLDQAYKNIDKNIEALIGVEYIVDRDFNNRDTRRIKNLSTAITFERLVEI